MIDSLAQRLLGRHVLRGSGDGARLREDHARFRETCDSEVSDVRAIFPVEQDVRGLDVPVHHPAPVGIVERVRHLTQNGHHSPTIRQSPPQQVGQRLAAEESHAHPWRAGIDPEAMDGHDVRMFELGDDLRFPLESLAELLVVEEFARQHLERHVAVKLRFVGLVDGRHAASAHQGDDTERSQRRTRFQQHP